MSFSPRLTTAFVQDGAVTHAYTAFCVVEYSSGSTGIDNYSHASSYRYTGSCLTATVVNSADPATTRLLVAGTTMENVRLGATGGVTFVGTLALVSSTRNPCDMPMAATASGSSDVMP